MGDYLHFLTIANRELRMFVCAVVLVSVVLCILPVLRGISEREYRRLIGSAVAFVLLLLGVFFIEDIDDTLGIIMVFASPVVSLVSVFIGFEHSTDIESADSFERYKSNKAMEQDPEYAGYLRNKIANRDAPVQELDMGISDDYAATLRMKAKHGELNDDERVVYMTAMKQDADRRLEEAKREHEIAQSLRKKQTGQWLVALLMIGLLFAAISGAVTWNMTNDSANERLEYELERERALSYRSGYMDGAGRAFYDLGSEYDGRYDDELNEMVHNALSKYRTDE